MRSAADRRTIAAHLAGRTADVEQIGALVASRRLVTVVTGSAGVGKSAMVAAIAAALQARGMAIAWLDRAAFSSREPLAAALAAALRDNDVAPDAEYLLVLDNADRFAWPLGVLAPELLARDHPRRLWPAARPRAAVLRDRIGAAVRTGVRLRRHGMSRTPY